MCLIGAKVESMISHAVKVKEKDQWQEPGALLDTDVTPCNKNINESITGREPAREVPNNFKKNLPFPRE